MVPGNDPAERRVEAGMKNQTAPDATLIIRLMAGSVFFWEGILKLVYANQGVGRFTKLGFPWPGTTATLIACFEIAGGLLLVAGLWTRVVAALFSIEMLVAMLSTKITLFVGTSPLAPPPVPPRTGIWAVLHEIRSEWAQLASCAFLVLVGAGALSLDAYFSRGRARPGLPSAAEGASDRGGSIASRIVG